MAHSRAVMGYSYFQIWNIIICIHIADGQKSHSQLTSAVSYQPIEVILYGYENSGKNAVAGNPKYQWV